MNSLEALKEIEEYYNCDINVMTNEFCCIEEDLEILEILKKYLVIKLEKIGGHIEYERIYCYFDDWKDKTGEDFKKVKEWLENE